MARTRKPALIYLDTHIVCWLYEGRADLLSAAAAEAIEAAGQLLVSPIVELELQYLHEIDRISKGPESILAVLKKDIGLEPTNPPLGRVVAQAHGLRWTRDPFDRLIVAETLLAGGRLITRDATIRRHFAEAVW